MTNLIEQITPYIDVAIATVTVIAVLAVALFGIINWAFKKYWSVLKREDEL